MEWQPIETAPKTGTVPDGLVLCWSPEWGIPCYCWWGEGVRGNEGGRWYEAGEAEWLDPQPTHWIALPPYPVDGP